MKEYKNCEDYKDYDEFLKDVKYLVENIVCPNCNSSYVIHRSPLTHSLLCGDCGECFDATIKKEEREE